MNNGVQLSQTHTDLYERNIGNAMRVTHIIGGLGQGGAQEMLYKLLREIAPQHATQSVISLLEGGPYVQRMRSLGIAVETLGMRRRGLRVPGIRRLMQAIRRSQPDVVQTWMYHSDFLGGLAARLLRPAPPVLWNIRHSNLERGVDRWTTRLLARCCARLSGSLPQHVLVNSECGRRFHAGLGYCEDRMTLIHNGFDMSRFAPRPEQGLAVRERCRIPHTAPVLGQVARFHPQKDFPTFVAAAERILAERPETHFVLCGRDVSSENLKLVRLVQQTRSPQHFHLLGEQQDVARIHSALDIGVLASAGEGFPNVIGEAMACGVPCVATDVGDVALVVGETGLVVPPRQPEALANACLSLLSMNRRERQRLGENARERICKHFSIAEISRQYVSVWSKTVGAANEKRRLAA